MLATTKSNDYAIIKVLYNLAKYEGDMNLTAGASIVDINSLSDRNDPVLGTNENLYIVGHGFPGGMWLEGHDSETTVTGDIPDYIASIIPDNWAGQIRVLTCRSAVAESEGGASWVDQLKADLKVFKLDDAVVGAEGYSYGTPNTSVTGMTSILRPEYEEFYKGGYSRSMEKVFKNKKLPSSETRKKSKKHADTPEKAAKEWVRVRDELEAALKDVVGAASKDGARSIKDTISNLNAAFKEEWEGLMSDQLTEFTHYGLFK